MEGERDNEREEGKGTMRERREGGMWHPLAVPRPFLS